MCAYYILEVLYWIPIFTFELQNIMYHYIVATTLLAIVGLHMATAASLGDRKEHHRHEGTDMRVVEQILADVGDGTTFIVGNDETSTGKLIKML